MNELLDEMEVNFDQLLRGFPTPYLIFRANPPYFTLVACSDVYLSVTQTVRTNILHRPLFEAFPETPGSEGEKIKQDFLNSFDRVMKTGVSDVMGVQRYDIPREDSPGYFDEKYWTVTNSPIFDSNGHVQYIVQRVEDITEYIRLKQRILDEDKRSDVSTWSNIEAEILRSSNEVKAANRDIKESNAELKEIDRLKTEFFSNVSHEFRTPLTLMLVPLEDLLIANDIHEQHYLKVEIAHRNALRLLKLVNTLLDFSRLEAKRTKAHFQAINISKFTKELASHFDSAVEKHGIKLIINCPDIPQSIYVDPDFYEKMVLNLISNAFKHTFEGTIEVLLNWVNTGIELIVRDTGVGIPEDQLPFIFERFHRVPNAKARTQEGSGIGLSLVLELVQLHHGKISVTSQCDKGTTFCIFLPSGKDHLPQEQVRIKEICHQSNTIQSYLQETLNWSSNKPQMTKVSQEIEENHTQLAKANILLADDNNDMRNYIQELLAPHYNVTTATNGKEALSKARFKKPDLILSDVMMPHMTGSELVKAIRLDPALKVIPIILLSARAGEEAKIEGLEIGADDYLIKPFSTQELLTRIKTHLALYKARFEAQEAIKHNMERAAKLKDQFISNMSHELRTPLNAIIGYSDMILQGMVNSPEMQQKFIENILMAGRHLLFLINDILDLSKIEAGKFSLNQAWINIKDFIAEIESMLSELAANKKVLMSFFITDEIKEVKADAIRLKQVMINLLNNAIKFNREDGKVDIRIEKSDDGKWTLWKIMDTGIGIPKNKLGDVFTEFYQVDNSSSRNYEGTGLGLAITKKLINLHGGSIWVDSQENIGSIFSFTLPHNMSDKTHD